MKATRFFPAVLPSTPRRDRSDVFVGFLIDATSGRSVRFSSSREAGVQHSPLSALWKTRGSPRGDVPLGLRRGPKKSVGERPGRAEELLSLRRLRIALQP